MGVAVRAAAENKALRNDVAVTGTIQPGGDAGGVGGIIDKSQAAARNGMRILVTPAQQLYENIILRALSKKYNFTAVQVGTLDEAYKIATSAPGQDFESGFKLALKQEPQNLTLRELEGDEARFKQVASKINGQLRQRLSAADGPLAEYSGHYGEEVARNERIIERGYPYTAANFAFLSLVDADFLTTPPESLDLGSAAAQVRECLAALPKAAPTDANFQWVMGADVRREWAEYKAEKTLEGAENFTSSEERYVAVRELHYAKSWCIAAGYLSEEADKIGGRGINASLLEAHARLAVADAEKQIMEAGLADPEAEWHLEVAKRSLSKKEWLAAIYDAAYSKAAELAYADELEGGGNQTETDRIARYGMKTLWGKIYQSQGAYIMQEAAGKGMQAGGMGKGAPPESARVLLLSGKIEDETQTILQIISGANAEKKVVAVEGGEAAKGPASLLAASIMMVAIVAMAAEFISANKR